MKFGAPGEVGKYFAEELMNDIRVDLSIGGTGTRREE